MARAVINGLAIVAIDQVYSAAGIDGPRVNHLLNIAKDQMSIEIIWNTKSLVEGNAVRKFQIVEVDTRQVDESNMDKVTNDGFLDWLSFRHPDYTDESIINTVKIDDVKAYLLYTESLLKTAYDLKEEK